MSGQSLSMVKDLVETQSRLQRSAPWYRVKQQFPFQALMLDFGVDGTDQSLPSRLVLLPLSLYQSAHQQI
jgi:hypothetical protein